MSQSHHELINQFLTGSIDRRTFIRRAVAAGVSASAVAGMLAAHPSASFAQSTPISSSGLPQVSAPRPDGTPVSDDQQILKMVTPSPFSMNPPIYTGDLWQLQLMVFQALTRIDSEGLVPGLADKWESDATATTWTFHLNPNAKFSDGSAITADDVIWTFSFIASPTSKSVSPDTFKNITGWDDVNSGSADTMSGITAPDPHTVVFKLKAADPAFPARVSQTNGVILQKANVTANLDEWWMAPVTSGFFKVTQYTAGDAATMTLERNEYWFRDPAKLSQIQISLIADPQTELVSYDNGEIDGMVAQPADFAQAVKGGDRAADLFWGYAEATWYFGAYCKKAPFDDANVRKAFAQALDLSTLSQAVLGGIYPPQPRIIPSTIPGGGTEQWAPTFDPDAAKASLAASSYGGPDGMPAVTIVINEQGGATALSTWAKVATAMQPMLQDNLGVTVNLVRQQFDTTAELQAFADGLDGGAIFRFSFGATIFDPSFISPVFHSGSSSNSTAYNNPDVDSALDAAAVELDADKRAQMYADIDKTVSEDAVLVAPFRGTSTWFFKPKVRGLSIINQRIWNAMHKIYIAQE